MEDKYDRVLKYCEQELERILKLFRKQRDDPPLPRNYPPIAGKVIETIFKVININSLKLMVYSLKNYTWPFRGLTIDLWFYATLTMTVRSSLTCNLVIKAVILESCGQDHSTDKTNECWCWCSGRIKWARSLHFHLEDLVKSASAHPVLKTLSATSELVRRYNMVANTLLNYQQDMKNAWLNHNVMT